MEVHGGMDQVHWRYGGMTRHGKCMEWYGGKMEVWRYGEAMEVWRYGGMEKRQMEDITCLGAMMRYGGK